MTHHHPSGPSKVEANELRFLLNHSLVGRVGDQMDDVLVAALIRQVADVVCPCTSRKLLLAVLDLMVESDANFEQQVERLVEQLLVLGDLLELEVADPISGQGSSTYIHAAPPSFVARSSGRVYLCGIAPDNMPFLPDRLWSRIQHSGAARYIEPDAENDLTQTMKELGLRQLSYASWSHAPKVKSATEFVDSARARIRKEGVTGDIPNLRILRPAGSAATYMSRWADPSNESGLFVGRRPRAYGSDLWCLIDLAAGRPNRWIDLPFLESRERGCDLAWRLQLALDAVQGDPATFKSTEEVVGWRVKVSFPLPLWAQRRLTTLSLDAGENQSAFSWLIPQTELASEEHFLMDYLWFVKSL
jgi:hypothetical protein